MSNAWQGVRERLLSSGWVPDPAQDTLTSPHNARAIGPLVLEGDEGKLYVASLRRHIESIREYQSSGFQFPNADMVLADFEQALQALDEVGAAGGLAEGHHRCVAGEEAQQMADADGVSAEEVLDRRMLEVFYGKAAGEDEFDEEVIERILTQGHAPRSSQIGGIEWVKASLRALTEEERQTVRHRIKLRLTGVLYRL